LALLGVVAGEAVLLEDGGDVVDEADRPLLGGRGGGVGGGRRRAPEQGQGERQTGGQAGDAEAALRGRHGGGLRGGGAAGGGGRGAGRNQRVDYRAGTVVRAREKCRRRAARRKPARERCVHGARTTLRLD